MIAYAQDMATGRAYGVFPLGDTLSLVDLEHPENPVVMIRFADLFLDERFREVASTPDADYLTSAPAFGILP